MNNKIWLSSPHMGGSEKKFVDEAFDTNWVAPLGPNVDGFENDLCKFTGSGYAAALSSGTSAIHLALIMLGVQPGDEIICQSMTFAASANPIAYVGATPIFVDSEKDTWNICPDLLRECIKDRIKKGKKPKAIIPVHLYGMPAKMDEIVAISLEYEIPIIEDAAEALGSNINGKMMGTFGFFGVLSFNGNKIITTSGGGALISDSNEHICEARFLATQARDNANHYEHSVIGYNYRMSNICAGIGRGQMEVLQTRVDQRRANYDFYRESLAEIGEISFLQEPNGYYSNRWLTTIRVSTGEDTNIDKEDIYHALHAENIECRPLWKPMHLQPVFKNAPFYGSGFCDELFKTGLCLPSGSNLSSEDLEKVVHFIKAPFLKH
ncbi:aminotransferase class I/II-fold pyridoxal phosphate-dependent enzyme [Pedobacter sp. MC2016-05]|uniref:DegT/DnrJ/EryC1/StrS family aminotransferase n=1 Tax=Pedobacter sp. MC2016-05 TaxID=2994474 RepID=UPI00224587DE|nr:aminotransferase class I/II-fold pyridoxal phosphate-dependent enzyme [Pedobacter sp. MC2016-05]MCX2473193.1 aminotransferase class I/II-fold pyridoxal phosphate-dependent enzyme [Pedobacter sp. MC2016-05]